MQHILIIEVCDLTAVRQAQQKPNAYSAARYIK